MVTCTAKDMVATLEARTFMVTVRDTMKLVVTVPANITATTMGRMRGYLIGDRERCGWA